MTNHSLASTQINLKLFLVSRDDKIGYDTYDSFVVCASDIEEAINTHPEGGTIDWDRDRSWCGLVWCDDVQRLSVKYLGIATGSLKKGVVCSTFKAG